MRKLIAAAAVLTAMSAAPAHAVIFQYYEGNNCTQKQLGSADAENLKAKGRYSLSWNLKAPGPEITLIVSIFNPIAVFLSPDTYNDEIRSVRILSNWHTVREASSPTFTVYDDPKGGSSDDWAKIYVSDASLIPDEGVCVGSFEKAFNKYGIRLERHPVNGLDGKISHVAVACDSACRNNLTPDPNPPAPVAEAPVPPKKRIPVLIGSAGDISRKTTKLPAGTKVAPAKKMAPVGSKVVRRPLP